MKHTFLYTIQLVLHETYISVYYTVSFTILYTIQLVLHETYIQHILFSINLKATHFAFLAAGYILQ